MAPRKKKKTEATVEDIVVFDENNKLDPEALKNMLRDFEFKNLSDTQKSILESLRRIEGKLDESTESLISFIMNLLSGAQKAAESTSTQTASIPRSKEQTEKEQNNKLAQSLHEAWDTSNEEDDEEYIVFLRLNEEYMKTKKVYPMPVLRGKWSQN